jgi:CheY-like chemotaxis protein
VPRALDAVLARMLTADPAARYPDYGPLLRDLAAVGLPDESPDAVPLADPPAAPVGPRLRVLVVYDDAKYIPLAQHALLAAGVPHDLTTVEDGRHTPAAVARDRRTGWGTEPDAVILGLTSPTSTSLRVLDAVRGSGRTPAVLWLSRSPDGAAMLRGLGLGVGVWATTFGDLEPLGAALSEAHTAANDRLVEKVPRRP